MGFCQTNDIHLQRGTLNPAPILPFWENGYDSDGYSSNGAEVDEFVKVTSKLVSPVWGYKGK